MLAVSESRWTGQGVTRLVPTPFFTSTQVHGVALILSPKAASSWEAAGSVFIPVSERIIRIRVKTHFGFATIIAIYAPVNPTIMTSLLLCLLCLLWWMLTVPFTTLLLPPQVWNRSGLPSRIPSLQHATNCLGLPKGRRMIG